MRIEQITKAGDTLAIQDTISLLESQLFYETDLLSYMRSNRLLQELKERYNRKAKMSVNRRPYLRKISLQT